MKATEKEYLSALLKANEDEDARRAVESLIKKHFSLIGHLQETSLYDVLEYEKRIAEPTAILAYENEKLKREVNELRKQLNKIEKYKTMG